MVKIEGKANIKVKVLADSISENGIRLTTYEVEYPRIIHSEICTHRMLSKNSFSSRAVPFEKMLKSLNGVPVRFGEANPGMQDKGKDYDAHISVEGDYWLAEGSAEHIWSEAKEHAVIFSGAFYKAGYHKQVYNRLLEPFQMMKTIISGTEWANFFWLRDDDAADPTLRELARCMREAMEASTPVLLKAGEYHLPYVDSFFEFNDDTNEGEQKFIVEDSDGNGYYVTLEQAIKVSCARCAAVSYRNEGYGLDKCLELYERLVGADKKHASALEHCATPMMPKQGNMFASGLVCNVPTWLSSWQDGVSHVDRTGQLWSGNLKGFIQYRKTIKGENYEG